MLDSKQRFSSRVDNYVKYRPSYPSAMWQILRDKHGLTADSIVADVGSGTGISSALWLDQGCTVYAVEPNAEMRNASVAMLGNNPRFHAVDGSAEETTLPDHSMDFVAAHQAFHWFDMDKTRPEFQRIVKPNGWIVLMWNIRHHDATPFLRGYEDLLLRYGTDYEKVRHDSLSKDETNEAFFGQGNFVVYTEPYVQQFDQAGLIGRAFSSSYTPEPDQPNYESLLNGLRDLHERYQHDGVVNFDYTTKMIVGRLV